MILADLKQKAEGRRQKAGGRNYVRFFCLLPTAYCLLFFTTLTAFAQVGDYEGRPVSTVEVILEGADTGEIKEPPTAYQSPGRIAFARSLPLAKARQDVLLAHRMNGEELAPSHGFPLRAVVNL